MAPRSPDWEYLGGLVPGDLEEEDTEKVATQLGSWRPGEQGEERLALAFLLVQAVMKLRSEECEEALQQLEDVEEVREENKRLTAAVNKMKDKQGDKESGIEELLEVERELEEVTRQLAAQAKDGERMKEEREELEVTVEELEKDKKKLRRQVASLETEVEEVRNKEGGEEADGASYDEQEVDVRRLKELEDTMRLKNKQIHQLLEDIEQLEKDSETYREKVGGLRDDLADATRQIQLITGEYVAMKNSQADTAGLVDSLKQDNCHLKTQLEDQYRERASRDHQIQQISTQVDGKVEEMKSICNFKDAQIEELRARLNRAAVTKDVVSESEASRQSMAVLSKAVKERDEQIERLQEEVGRASEELEASAHIIEELKGSGRKGGPDPVQRSLLSVRAQLHEASQQVAELKEQVAEAEEAARDKTEELSDAITKLRQYEEGEFGLTEAVAESSSLKKEVRARDRRVEQLIQQADSLQYQVGEVGQENSELRERLGMEGRPRAGERKGEGGVVEGGGRGQQDRALVTVLQRELERLEEERIVLKTENRKLAQQCGARAAKLGLEPGDLAAIQEYSQALRHRRRGLGDTDSVKLAEGSVLAQRELEVSTKEVARLEGEVTGAREREEQLEEEVNKLREGLHEILDSVREQDGRSDVAVSSPTLEKLLTILDARHLYGEYRPAMGLQSAMDRLEGANTQLREQLRRARQEEDRALAAAQRLKTRLQAVEGELKGLRGAGAYGGTQVPAVAVAAPPAVASLPPQISASGAETVAKLENQLVHVLEELEAREAVARRQEGELGGLARRGQAARHQLGVLYNEHKEQAVRWERERRELEEKVAELEGKWAGAVARVEECEEHMEALKQGQVGGGRSNPKLEKKI